MYSPLLRVILPMTATVSLLFPQVCGAYMTPDEVFGTDGTGRIPTPEQAEESTYEQSDIAPTAQTQMKPAAQPYAPASGANNTQEFSLLGLGGAVMAFV